MKLPRLLKELAEADYKILISSSDTSFGVGNMYIIPFNAPITDMNREIITCRPHEGADDEPSHVNFNPYYDFKVLTKEGQISEPMTEVLNRTLIEIQMQ